MKYTSRTVRCNEPGLTQEQALSSLYSHYGEDIRVSSVKRRGDAWVVTILQKKAEFPPKDDAEGDGPPKDDAPTDDAPSDDAPDAPPFGDDGPPSGDDGEGPDKKDPQGEILHLLHEIATALGVSGGLDDKLPPEGDLPGPPPPGPDAGFDAGPDGPPVDGPGPAAAKKPTKLKPGEVLPNQTPIGAPAFASTKTAATMTVESAKVNPATYKASQAQADLEANFQGYKVKQLAFDRTASVYRALISIH
jgi:hypothetical protein